MPDCDVAIIGGGPGGYVGAIRAAQLGLNTVCIEMDKTLGGTCVNVGCIPSKALLSSSEHYEFAKLHAAEHGIQFADVKLDLATMMKRKDAVVGQNTKGIEYLFRKNKVAWAHGRGTLKKGNVIDVALLEFSIREDLNLHANRVMGVLRPLRVVIENYPEEKSESFDVPNNPEDPDAGTRQVPFSRVIYIESDDFMEEPPKKFFRLAPGREVRLRSAYFITCTSAVKNEAGEIVELRATYDPSTRGGDAADGRKPKATLHWVSARHALDCEVRLYDRLFRSENPEESGDFLADLNPDSLEVVPQAKLEPSVRSAAPFTRFQFERLGYFCVDPDSSAARIVFNRTATLKDTFTRMSSRA